ncbi:MAG: carboxypeptidase-like regulatory domain-containing protein [Candidatus Eremiobacter antarcticus]|nr:carboxypeptidase regulatory-like domain-containing protein [Candidatus Eremiobacteraeota bacterium]MBC5807450.1 carboxypeptidase regulatory-like domain-containing protein [Candidatus Eremiobacteraeota bacterium]
MARLRIVLWCVGLIAAALLCVQDRADTKTQAAIYGGVVDASHGRPLAGVTVLIFDPRGDKPLASASTDAAGKYRLEGLKAGAYRLRFHKAGYYGVEMTGVNVSADERVILAGALAMSAGSLAEAEASQGSAFCGNLVQPGVTADVYVICAGR